MHKHGVPGTKSVPMLRYSVTICVSNAAFSFVEPRASRCSILDGQLAVIPGTRIDPDVLQSKEPPFITEMTSCQRVPDRSLDSVFRFPYSVYGSTCYGRRSGPRSHKF
ncbi:hypothetical protein CPSG_04044 [Coccidioides posadasii str. Silveira]|uniref:Uncharacterized protein n=2 Tax=Coccidioides posadasii TaxID=199306 RepID=E9D1I6_COCPS|nr:hypothetical protein CPSG_04044 [Coccidioides posadasii str. Silveira]KMM72115.1 hypothetical protein CPAG_08414 [Coccidioides posadasii RMSCC 3488]